MTQSMIRFIENIGDYYSQHFFSDDFPKKVFDKAGYVTQKKDTAGEKTDNHLSEINARISPLREKYYRFKNDLLTIQREKDKVKRTHEFHKEVLSVLGYINGTPEYSSPVFLNDTEVIPVRYQYNKGGKPYLFVMEMKAMVREGDQDPPGIYDQTWVKEEWEKVFPAKWGNYILKPDIIKDALSELFLLPEDERPVYVILLAGAKIFLIHYEKWKYDSFLLFDLEELFVESQVPVNRDYLALFYALLAKNNFLGSTDSLLQSLDEDAHKAAYGVTQNLKRGVIYAVENLANEAIWFKLAKAKTAQEKEAIQKLMAEEKFAKELKDECLTMVYRLLFLFYAEAREDLEILPVKDTVYQKGYSLEMLRDLEMTSLTTDSSRNGYFFSKSLWKLFDYLHNGVKTTNGFEMKPLDSPLFDNEELKHIAGVQFRNIVLQQIIKRLSLSDQSKSKRIGRISYANLGINQLGSVYESLLAYSGFFAAETLIEVKAADDPDGKEGTFLVPLARRDDFTEEEILKDPDNPLYDKQIPKGQFVYRLNGRDRKNSASYYTPEVLTQTTVKYTLKGIIDKLKERQEKGEDCADEILGLKILEPAMGAAAFHNEVINQLADAYLELKETEEVRKGRKRIIPGQYNDELQKVKAFIAANNVYGVDLNPTAVELGKLSLWLNCIHRNMETPFFAHRLGTGNAVVGCWLKTYAEEDVIVEFPKEGTTKQRHTPIPKAWWAKEPKRVKWDSKGNLTRKQHEYYHFLLPDDNMLASANIKLIKDELTVVQKNAITKWKKEMKQPLTRDECRRLSKICTVIDTLLEKHYQQIKSIIKETTSTYRVYGQQAPQIAMKGYDEKELLSESRNARTAPFYKLRMIMDYWCSLWFWDARKVADLPTRAQWYNEIENILGVDLSDIHENATAKEVSENIKKRSGETTTLFRNNNRLNEVELIRDQHRFFHHELEFVEAFKENGGFDIAVGNPPWLKLQFEEKEIIAEQFPEVIIRKTTAPQVNKLLESYLASRERLSIYIKENISINGSAEFLNAKQNYRLLIGQQTNLYKCVLENGFTILNNKGYLGLLHPESVYDDPSGGYLRREIYIRLRKHFHFKNILKLFQEVHHRLDFSVNIYGSRQETISFASISNILHPNQISSFETESDDSVNNALTIKENDNWTWNLKGNSKRIIKYNPESLSILSKVFEEGVSYKEVKLINIQSSSMLEVLGKLSNSKERISTKKPLYSEGLHETNAISKGEIVRKVANPELSKYELILSGPMISVSYPLFKSPNIICVESSHYDFNDLQLNKNLDLPRTPFLPSNKFQYDLRDLNSYRVGFRKMVDVDGERTLQPALLAPKMGHINSILTLYHKDHSILVSILALTSSIVYDFFIKTIGSPNIYGSRLDSLPISINNKIKPYLFLRALRLNCIHESYSDIWNELFDEKFKQDSWSCERIGLELLAEVPKEWSGNVPLKNLLSRRQALVEIDVLVAMNLGIDLNELLQLYLINFSILKKFEDDTWYDVKGNIVFTPSSKTFKGVGLDRKEWDEIKSISNGEKYVHTITKSELYQGQQITYYPPFDKCDRVEDYKVAWAHFEKIFAAKEN